MVSSQLALALAALLPSVLASEGMGYNLISKRSYKPHYPVCPYSFEPFEPVGCYNDLNGRALRFRPGINGPDMTHEKCWSACKNNGFRYAGLEYYGQCSCGSTIDGTPYVDNGDSRAGCSYACNGNPDQICGGSKAITVFRDPTYPPKTEAELETAGAEYTAIGCFAEVDGRLLTDDQPDINGASMTVELCLSQCGKQGYAYAGVEYGQECWCAGKLAPGVSPIDDSKCNLPCKGNTDQTCGGRSTIYVYYNDELDTTEPCGENPTTTTTTTTAPPPTTTTTEEPPTTTPTTTTEEPTTTTTTTTEEPTTTTTTTTTEEPTTTTTTTEEPTTTTTTTTTAQPTPTTTKSTTKSTTSYCPPTTTKRTTTKSTTTKTTTTSCRTRCGGYCAPPLPTFSDKPSCKDVAAKCWSQVNECMEKAGPYAETECIKLASGCAIYHKYCKDKCNGYKCNKKDCDDWDGWYPPTKPTYTPKPTKTPKPPKYTPTPTNNACVIPTAYKNPVGGIKAPVVSCNDDRNDYGRGNCWKVFSSQKSNECASFPRGSIGDACIEACNIQYENCRVQYGGGTNKPKMNKNKKHHKKSVEVLEKRTWGYGWTWDWVRGNSYNSYNDACNECKKQRDACIQVNKANPNGNKYCKKYGYFT